MKGDRQMVTQLGKILRIIRINTGDSMRIMAQKLDMSVSYLSAIENNKRNIPSDFEGKIISKYELSEKDKTNLRNAITQTAKNMKVNISELSEKKKKLLYAISKDELDDATIDKLCAIVEKKGN